MSTFSRTATLFSTVVLGSMLTTTTVSSVNTIVNAAETTQAVATKKNYDLKILQGNSDAASTASQFYLNTISLEKQANGNYYAYLTSNTPVNLGDEPISSEDTQHQVVKMGTTQKNGYNQTVYRLTLTADELASGQPIKTKIHVNIPMMNYDHDYDIRLAIQGFKPEAASSSSSNSSSSTANSSSSVSSSSNTSTSSTADSSTTSVAPTSSSQTSSSSQSSNNDTATSSVVNNGQNNSSDTASSTVVSDDTTTSSTGSTINIAADQGMSRFLKPTARIDVKGEQTDITLSLNDASLAKMIPSLTLDGQTKSVSGQDTTFTVPTKDLVPDKDGKLTLKSLTHVSAQGYTHDYPSNITFDVSQLITQNNLKTGNYQIAVSPDSHMDSFFAKEFNVKVGALTSVVSVTYQVPSMMGMIPSVTFDGQTKSVVNKSTTVDFTIPTKDLVPGKDGKVTLKSFTSVPMSPSKGYNSNITFDMNPALGKSTSDSSNSSSSSSESTASSDKDILQDGTYSINYNVYKSGTTTDSTMKTYMKSPANVAVKNGQATITFATQNDAMSMMKEFSVNDVAAKADGNNWVVTVPVSALSKTMKSNMTISVPQMGFTEKPSADIVFDMSSVKKTGNNGASSSSASSASSSSKASSASSSHASSASSSNQNNSKTDITKDGKYSVNYHVYKSGTTTDSAMAKYMTSSATVAVKNSKATITFATKNDAMSMMKEFSVNDVAAKADGNNWVVTVPVSDLSKTMKSNMTISVPQMDFTEKPSADIVFDMSSVKKTGNNGGGSAASSSSASSTSSSSKVSSSSSSSEKGSSESSTKPTNPTKTININKDGRYQISYHVYQTGTKKTSTMQQYMTSTAIVNVKNGKATINFKTQNGAMSLMKYFAVNGHKAQAKENGWQVTLPVSDLLHTLQSNMTIYVPKLNFTERPTADIVFNVKNVQSTNQKDNLGKNINPTGYTTSSDNLGAQNRLGIPNATLHQLTILQGNSNSTSVAAQYFLPTIQLVKNSNGSYTGYVTTHTPAMMGSAPITFMDGTHHVTRMSNFKTGNYYQAVYRFSLSANEIKAPIATTIHVHFTAPLSYDHTYTIRFVIGRTLNNASEATQPTTGLPSMSDNTLTTALNTSDVSRGTSDPVATGTFENTSANTDSAFSQQSDEKANKPKHSDKKVTVKSDTDVSKDTKADQKDNTTRRNILIVAGGIIAAALGYVGVSLLTNFFKKG
ncbi:NEAT domain-containing protein [Weissella paramesenteroides]|uniref:NEAT domain-containing protein n=1 Tax=Weissella paramesenteroides TaxID=1249 RepID=UPI002072CA9A|nr:NEAT domain-containing protein [Weissella paramesenteroides]MCM6764742.1 NEAT domain-containing protein [Weissella paramesenteroides]MCM6768148.1 NEAT domain-containing protein [Weissella paramesenteroides]MCM6770679.1 NEAT domain-containing protein [Weissella paramesenteroides]MCM6780602.1 NEAT domain-containing protein [Weissella paramesenteroides]MCM6782674.1 NEAT domain-containing protein [Weissella paramesenteroides]